MKAVLLGATRGMGRAVARVLAARGERLFLLGRDPEALARSARDLEVRGAPAPVGTARCDLLDPDGFAAASRCGRPRARRLRRGDPLRGPVRAAGRSSSPIRASGATCSRRTSRIASSGARRCGSGCSSRGGGTLCVFSSVAGERGRAPVVFYGAAKAGLSRYLEALDHRYHAEGLRVITVKPGFVHTAMTDGLEPPPFAGSRTRSRARPWRRSIAASPWSTRRACGAP